MRMNFNEQIRDMQHALVYDVQHVKGGKLNLTAYSLEVQCTPVVVSVVVVVVWLF